MWVKNKKQEQPIPFPGSNLLFESRSCYFVRCWCSTALVRCHRHLVTRITVVDYAELLSVVILVMAVAPLPQERVLQDSRLLDRRMAVPSMVGTEHHSL
jgi:hypothetical protein